jgi:hypothetical protein
VHVIRKRVNREPETKTKTKTPSTLVRPAEPPPPPSPPRRHTPTKVSIPLNKATSSTKHSPLFAKMYSALIQSKEYTTDQIGKELTWLRSLSDNEFEHVLQSLQHVETSTTLRTSASDQNAKPSAPIPTAWSSTARLATAPPSAPPPPPTTTTTAPLPPRPTFQDTPMLKALELHSSVSLQLQYALRETRNEICGKDDLNDLPALHEINHSYTKEQFQLLTKKQKTSIIDRLQRGILIRRKILKDDVRKSIWAGLEDPKHLHTIQQYEKKIQRWSGKSKKTAAIKDTNWVDNLIEKWMKEYTNASQQPYHRTVTTRLQQQNLEHIDLTKLTELSRSAMKQLQVSLHALKERWR